MEIGYVAEYFEAVPKGKYLPHKIRGYIVEEDFHELFPGITKKKVHTCKINDVFVLIEPPVLGKHYTINLISGNRTQRDLIKSQLEEYFTFESEK